MLVYQRVAIATLLCQESFLLRHWTFLAPVFWFPPGALQLFYFQFRGGRRLRVAGEDAVAPMDTWCSILIGSVNLGPSSHLCNWFTSSIKGWWMYQLWPGCGCWFQRVSFWDGYPNWPFPGNWSHQGLLSGNWTLQEEIPMYINQYLTDIDYFLVQREDFPLPGQTFRGCLQNFNTTCR